MREMRDKRKAIETLESIKEGYLPHEGMGIFRCEKCGGTVFDSYAQGICPDAPVWTYEYYCVKCNHMMGLTRRQ